MYARQNISPRTVDGPYKATNIWNEIVYAFRFGLPTRRHRRLMRFHEDSFAASDAVDWLHAYLNRNPTFGIVSRHQTVQLLSKFLKSNVIEDVRGRDNAFTTNQFLDNRDLYRFTRFSPMKFPRSPLKACMNTMPSRNSSKTVKQKVPLEHGKSVLTKLQSPKTPHWQQLPSVAEVEDIWRKTLVEKMDSVVSVLGGSDSERDIFDGIFVNAKRVIHNSTRIGQSGIVDSLDRSLELPHWVLSAMKCLITWPKASGVESCLPNYPGFERDVFNVVRDYFEKLDEPLIAVSLYNVLTTVYVLVEQFDASLRRANGMIESKRDTHWSAHSVDTLSERMSKVLSVVDDSSERDQPPTFDVDAAVSCPNLAANSKVVSSDKLMNTFLCFETDFETDIPVTNIVHPLNNTSRPIRTQSVLCIGQPEPAAPRCNSVDAALNWHGGHHARKIQGVDDRESVLNVLLNESGGYVNLACNEMTSAITSGRCEHADPDQEGYVNWGCTELSNDEDPPLCSAASCDVVKSDPKKERVRLRRSASSSTLPTHAELMAGRPSDIWTWNPTDKCLRRYGSDPDVRTVEGKKLAVEAVRLCLLLLPPDNRRNLHRLLRFMLRMSENKQLQLDIHGLPNRKLVLNTFGRCLLRPVCEPDDLDDGFSSRFVAFLVDNQDIILEAPLDLIASVDAQLATIDAAKKLKHGGDAASSAVRSLTYCEQVSEAEFERQKRSVSQRAVADLLDGIAVNTRLSDHEKRKKLKQFKKMYPAIYAARFPSETEAQAGVKRSAPVFFKKPFQRLLEMRL